MKKITVLLIAAVLSFSAFAQESSQHLAFKGVPIDGTLAQFVANMKAKVLTAERIKMAPQYWKVISLDTRAAMSSCQRSRIKT